METIDLEELDTKLNRIPVVIKCEPLSLSFLNNLDVISYLKNFIYKMDSLEDLNSKRIVILDYLSSEFNRFPMFKLSHNPYNADLSEPLFNKYNKLSSLYLVKNKYLRLLPQILM